MKNKINFLVKFGVMKGEKNTDMNTNIIFYNL